MHISRKETLTLLKVIKLKQEIYPCIQIIRINIQEAGRGRKTQELEQGDSP